MARQSISGLECSFGGESSSATRRSITVKIDRAQLEPSEVDELLVGNTVDCELVGFPPKKKRGGDVDGQTIIGGGEVSTAKRQIKVKGLASCTGASIKPDSMSFSLRFERDIEKLELLAGRDGRADIKKVGKIEKPEKAAEGEGEEE